ncbi:MAG: hypothetical protein WD077_12210 [Bacteroidia bacterium]
MIRSVLFFPLLVMISCGGQRITEDDRIVEPRCDSIFLDTEQGTLNGLTPDMPQEIIKEQLPCFTGDTPDSSDFNCGGGVFFRDRGFFFYTFLKFIEIRKGFGGRSTHDLLLGKTPGDVRELYGRPSEFSPPDFYLYPMGYGCLRINFLSNTVTKVAVHYVPCEEVETCE